MREGKDGEMTGGKREMSEKGGEACILTMLISFIATRTSMGEAMRCYGSNNTTP